MELMNAILTRRSIRQYKDADITEELLMKLLKAAMYAPSARNYQPWQFIVINDKSLLNKIPEVHPFAEMMKQASLGILVCGDRTIEPSDGYLAINCAAATQNLLLAIHDSDLGGVWLGVYPKKERMDEMSKLFNLPDNIMPVSLVALGTPNETKKMPERFIRARIHFNRWEQNQ